MSKQEIENKIIEIQRMINEDLKNKVKTDLKVKKVLYIMKDRLAECNKVVLKQTRRVA